MASGSTQTCGFVSATSAAAIIGRCCTASLHISIGGDDPNASSDNLVLSPASSPSFSFDSARDIFAAMDSPTSNGVMMLKSPQTEGFPLDDGFLCGANTRVSVLSPTTKRPRKSTNVSSASSGSNTSSTVSSSSVSRASSRTSGPRRYTSILSRCLPKHMKSSTATTSNNNSRDEYHEVTSESPSCRATDTPPTTCSALTSSSPPARKHFGTVLLNDDHHDLHHLFRDEAEYSDYLSALVTGAHSQMDAVVFYELEVHLSQMQWKLYRRFSEFRTLRQDLIKHFSRRLRHQQAGATSNSSSSGASSPKCEICAHMLTAIEQTAFPSRQQTHRHWHKLFKSSSSSASGSSEVDHVESTAAKFSTEAVIADRKAKFGEFVALCLRTMRGLRQHGKVMEDSSACEIGTALRLIEEFFGLSFTRYLRFLSERGVVSDVSSNKGTKQQTPGSGSVFTTGGRRRLTAVI